MKKMLPELNDASMEVTDAYPFLWLMHVDQYHLASS
jgi:hypothetical protein